MRRASSIAIAFAAVMVLGTSAFAAGVFFQTEPTTATAICPDPCFNVQMFAQDDSAGGTRVIQAIQFDVNVVNSNGYYPTSEVDVANLPVPPTTNTNAGAGNTTITDNTDPEDPNQTTIPWELSATIGKSPTAGQDVLVVVASAFPHTVQELLAARHVGDANFSCALAGACTPQLNGLNARRIYLGFFRMSGVTADTTFTYSGATGNGELVTGVAGVSGSSGYYNGPLFYIAERPAGCRLGSATGCLAGSPEPTTVLLVGAALLGLCLIRRRA